MVKRKKDKKTDNGRQNTTLSDIDNNEFHLNV